MTKHVALVTGGTGGIGTAICESLASSGHRVVANYFPSDRENAEQWLANMRQRHQDVYIEPADVTNYDDCKAKIERIEAQLGPVDVLVNCAGITRDKTLKRMTPEMWQAVIDTNLTSAFNMTQLVVTGMTERGFGRIINISSVNGQRGQFGQANYAAAKAGLHGFTMSVAQETAAKGVTVNTVSPGYIETAMTSAMPEEVLQAIVNSVPARRMGKPEEIANAVAWLADEKNAYTTGANIPVNGGLFMAA
jgi:acetoacetyl-CoA reductase